MGIGENNNNNKKLEILKWSNGLLQVLDDY